MKKVLMLSLVMLCAILSHGQQLASLNSPVSYSSPIINQYNGHVPDVAIPGERMRNVGRGLTVGGVGLAVLGIVLMSSADAIYYSASTGSNGTQESGDPKGALGLMMTMGGVGMTVTGIILWSKGQKKYNHYKERQSVSFKTGGTTATLRYNF